MPTLPRQEMSLETLDHGHQDHAQSPQPSTSSRSEHGSSSSIDMASPCVVLELDLSQNTPSHGSTSPQASEPPPWAAEFLAKVTNKIGVIHITVKRGLDSTQDAQSKLEKHVRKISQELIEQKAELMRQTAESADAKKKNDLLLKEVLRLKGHLVDRAKKDDVLVKEVAEMRKDLNNGIDLMKKAKIDLANSTLQLDMSLNASIAAQNTSTAALNMSIGSLKAHVAQELSDTRLEAISIRSVLQQVADNTSTVKSEVEQVRMAVHDKGQDRQTQLLLVGDEADAMLRYLRNPGVATPEISRGQQPVEHVDRVAFNSSSRHSLEDVEVAPPLEGSVTSNDLFSDHDDESSSTTTGSVTAKARAKGKAIADYDVDDSEAGPSRKRVLDTEESQIGQPRNKRTTLRRTAVSTQRD